MSLKTIYKKTLGYSEAIPIKLEYLKTVGAETRAVINKSHIYNSVKWTKAQQNEFDDYWLKHYGKRISNKWHRLYQASSGVYQVDYIPEMLYTTKIEPMMVDRKYASVLEDKSILETLCQSPECTVPETIIVCSNGQYYDDLRRPITKEEAINRISSSRIVLKPTIGGNSGRGIEFYNGETSPDYEKIYSIINIIGDDFIAQKQIIPHPDFARLNSNSINTIRLITYICNNTVHHAPVSLRIGRSGSNVDNIHAGGLVIGVEDNGCLHSKAYELGYGDKSKTYNKHPDNGVGFEGLILPSIQRIISVGENLHGRFPHIGIISWDFTVDKDANPVLIETNIVGQSVWFPQIAHGKGIFGENTEEILQMLRKAGGKSK